MAIFIEWIIASLLQSIAHHETGEKVCFMSKSLQRSPSFLDKALCTSVWSRQAKTGLINTSSFSKVDISQPLHTVVTISDIGWKHGYVGGNNAILRAHFPIPWASVFR